MCKSGKVTMVKKPNIIFRWNSSIWTWRSYRAETSSWRRRRKIGLQQLRSQTSFWKNQKRKVSTIYIQTRNSRSPGRSCCQNQSKIERHFWTGNCQAGNTSGGCQGFSKLWRNYCLLPRTFPRRKTKRSFLYQPRKRGFMVNILQLLSYCLSASIIT